MPASPCLKAFRLPGGPDTSVESVRRHAHFLFEPFDQYQNRRRKTPTIRQSSIKHVTSSNASTEPHLSSLETLADSPVILVDDSWQCLIVWHPEHLPSK